MSYYRLTPFLSVSLLLLVTLSSMAGGVDIIHHLPFPGNIAAAHWNPALLGVSPYGFNVEFNPLFFHLWTDGWNPNQILYHINDYWDEERKEELLDVITKESLSTGIDMKSGLYVGFDSWAFSTGLRGYVHMGLDKDLFAFLLYGTGPDPDLALDFSHTYLQSRLILDTAFHRAFSLTTLADSLGWESLYLGAGLHILSGLSLLDVKTDLGLVSVFESEEEAYIEGEGEVEIFYSISGDGGGGLGASLDLGLWGEIRPMMGIGLSLTNLGFMRWDGLYRDYYRGYYKFGHPLSLVEDEEEYSEMINEPQDPLYMVNPISMNAGSYFMVHPRVELTGGIGLKMIGTSNSHMYASLASRLHLPRFLPLILALEYNSDLERTSLSTSFGLKLGGFEPLTITLSDIFLLTGEGREGTIGLHTSLRF